jgi:hypothetical protein
MPESYLQKFIDLFKELRQNNSVEIIAEEIPTRPEEDLAEYSINKLRNRFGFEVPERYVEYVDASLHTHLRFVFYVDNHVAGGGEFHLYPLSDTLLSNRDPELWHKGMDHEKIEFLKRLRIFDDHPDAGDFKLAAFYLDPVLSPPTLPPIYFYDRGNFWLMDQDYGGYLDSLLNLFGVNNWQYIYCDLNDMSQPARERIYEELSKTLSELQTLFPDRDFAPYQARLADKRS